MLGLMTSTYGNNSDDGDDDVGMMARIDPSHMNGREEASVEQRDAMLARLDDMLIVPPHLEQNGHEYSGQFDDAEEEEELDENDRTIL